MAVIFFNMLLMLDSTTTRFNYNSSFMALKYGRRECLLNLASAICLKITTISIIDGIMRYLLLTWNEKKQQQFLLGKEGEESATCSICNIRFWVKFGG